MPLATSSPRALPTPLCLQLTSDPTNANVDQDEIDFEFINAHPAKAPGCVWTNAWVNAKYIGPSHCGITTTVDTYRTYSIDWQKDKIGW
jgi:hypothetical protein